MGNSCCSAKEQEHISADAIPLSESFRINTPKECKKVELVNKVRISEVHCSKNMKRTGSNNSVGSKHSKEKSKDTFSLLTSRTEEHTLDIPVRTVTLRLSASDLRCEDKKENFEQKYRICEIIGRGSFGEVKKIKHRVKEYIRALKIINKKQCQMTDNFVDEIKIIKMLDHPNVVRFYEFYQDEEYYYLVTDYCEGGDLLNKISRLRKLSEPQAARIILHILQAITYCHSMNVVHRDLKPENLLFDGPSIDSTVKVIDFGRSKILAPKTKIIERAGSVIKH